MRREWLRALTCAVFIAITTLPITPVAATDYDTCKEKSGDLAITACTAGITSGRYTYNLLADLFSFRCAEYAQKDQNDLAIQDCDQAIRLKPKFFSAFNNRGDAYSNKGQYDRAIQDYDQAIWLNPNYTKAIESRAKAIAKKKQ